MAIHKSVKKRHRQSVAARSRNRTIRGQLKTAVKQVVTDDKSAPGDMAALSSLLDKAVKRNIIHKNTAARKKSRIMKMLNKKAKSN